MTRILHHDDPYLLEFDASVVDRRTHDGRPAVVLDQTAFYAESGGQPSDAGTLEGVPVTAVLYDGCDVLHVLDRPLAAGRVHGRVDPERRRDHRQQHHGQHLLSRAFVEVAEARTVSFHLGAGESTIDLDREVAAGAVAAAERRANEVVQEAHPVAVRTVPRAEAVRLGVTVPAEAGDAVRLVHAEGFDLQACGGTHPRSTAEVGAIVVIGHERYKGGTRVRFVCGMRALAEVRRRNAALDEACAALSAPVDALAAAARRLAAEKAAADRRARELHERAVEAEARRLLADGAAGDGPSQLVVALYDGWSPDDLRALARHLVAGRGCVALLGSRTPDKAHLLFARTDDAPCDIPALLRDAVTILGGRGGGKGTMAQGGGDRVERLDEALAAATLAARQALGPGPR